MSNDTAFEWKKIGQLPQAAAYGVTISTEKGSICVGGTTATHSLSDVFLLSLQKDTLKRETDIPGEPRVQPVCVAQDGKLYVWGGFAPAVEGHQASLSVDGYMYSPETKEWSSVATPYDAEGNEISLGGGMGTSFGEGMILCAGGVDKDIFLKALQGIYAGKEYLSHPVEWYRFNRNLLLYHPQTDKWTTLGEYEQGARAGAVIVSQDGFHYIINGELKPGIRTNEINRIKEKRR